MENAQICLNGQREEAPWCLQCWNPVALNLIWTVPKASASLLPLLCASGVRPASPGQWSVASAPRPLRPQCVGGQVEPLMRMAWSPSTDSDEMAPSLSSSLCISPFSSVLWSRWSELLTDLPMTPPSLRSSSPSFMPKVLALPFSNPKRRTGAGLVNKPFLQRVGELASLPEAA